MRRSIVIGTACVVLAGSTLGACQCNPRPRSWTPADVVRLVAQRDAGLADCPKPGSSSRGKWRYGRVFPLDPTGPALPASMERLCFYEWLPARDGAAADLDALQVSGLGAMADDPVVVGLLGTPGFDAAQLTRLRDNFLGSVESRALPPSAGGLSGVTIGVPDSSPTSDGAIVPGAIQHGFNVAWIAQKIACPGDSPCPIYPSMELALAYPAGTSGGSAGTTTQLAAAIYAVVTRWKAAKAAAVPNQPAPPGATAHLVINLSVGWEPQKGGCELPSKSYESKIDEKRPGEKKKAAPPKPSESVRDALEYAVCNGALVISAAGNKTPASTPDEGLVCPARWEAEKVDCPDRFGPATEKGVRLTYAVAGLDYQGALIPETRGGALPHLAAPAYRAVAFPGAAPLESSRDLTGTSAAAAAVSGMAAAVWAYQPSLGPSAVMQNIYASGTPLPASPMCGVACTDIHRASLCRAVKSACAASCSGVPPWDCQNPSFTPAAELLPGDVAALKASFPAGVVPVPYQGTGAPLPPPSIPGSDPGLVVPQPGDTPCPACLFVLQEGNLYVSIDSSYSSTLTDMRLDFYQASNAIFATYANLAPRELRAGDRAIEGIGAVPSADKAAYATLTWSNSSGGLTRQRIYLAQP